MIEFSCSCGKSYRLPDRNANREVRCNQCEKTLIVPQQSQKNPVILTGVHHEPKTVSPVAEPTVEPTIEKPDTKDIEKLVVDLVPSSTEPATVILPPEPQIPVPSPATAAPEPHHSFTADVPLPGEPTTPLFNNRGSSVISCGILVLLLVTLIGVGVVGVVFGRLSAGITLPSAFEEIEWTNLIPPSDEIALPTDWVISEETFPQFDIRTADGGLAELTLEDSDPVAAKSEKRSTRDTLDDIDAALGTAQSTKETVVHTVSLRIDSPSGEELCVFWPRSRNAGLDETDIKELKFSVYFAKAVKFADFRIRIGDSFGTTEFVPTEKELSTLCDKGRNNWVPVSIPISGDDHWQRTEHGRMTPKTVDFIEFRAKPTGSGVTFWIDNLSIGR